MGCASAAPKAAGQASIAAAHVAAIMRCYGIMGMQLTFMRCWQCVGFCNAVAVCKLCAVWELFTGQLSLQKCALCGLL